MLLVGNPALPLKAFGVALSALAIVNQVVPLRVSGLASISERKLFVCEYWSRYTRPVTSHSRHLPSSIKLFLVCVAFTSISERELFICE